MTLRNPAIRLLFPLLLGCAALLASGCQGPVFTCRFETAVGEDCAVRRSVSLIARPGRPGAPAEIDLARYLRLPPADRYAEYGVEPSRASFSGRFATPAEIPVDFVKLTPGAEAWAQNRVDIERRDYVLLQVYTYEEVFDDIVERPESDEALQQGVRLLLEALLAGLEARFGADYDLAPLEAYLREALPDLAQRLYQVFWEVRRSRRDGMDAETEELEWEVRSRRELARHGIELLPETHRAARKANEARLWAFLEAKLAALTAPRRAETPPLAAAAFQGKENQAALLAQVERSIVASFGSIDNFVAQTDPLVPTVFGAYFGKRLSLVQDDPGFRFLCRLTLPGYLIQSNGTRDLDGSLLWRFTDAQMMLTGYRLRARSLLVDETALARLHLVGFPGSLEVVEDLYRALSLPDGRPDPRLVALLRQCVETGSLQPLQEAAIPPAAGTEPDPARAPPESAIRLLGLISAYYRPYASSAAVAPVPAPAPAPQPRERKGEAETKEAGGAVKTSAREEANPTADSKAGTDAKGEGTPAGNSPASPPAAAPLTGPEPEMDR